MLGIVLTGLLVGAMAGFTWLVYGGQLDEFDRLAEENISSWNIKGLSLFFSLITNGLTMFILAILAFGWYMAKRQYQAANLIALAALGGAFISTLLKNIFQRVRPDVEVSQGIYCYPSGHAMEAFCLFGILIYLGWPGATNYWWRIISRVGLVALIIAVGLSRIYFNFHYPSDVVAGFLTGGAYLTLLIMAHQGWLYRKIR